MADIQTAVGLFEEDPYLKLGDADSGHGVIFGRLEGVGPVAVKPFTQVKKAEIESENLRRVQERGFVALEPAMVAVSGLHKAAGYLVTKRHPDLRHLGQFNWSRSPEETNQIVKPALSLASETLAAWHGSGIFHGDAQTKNLAYTNLGDSVYVDAEATHFDGEIAVRRELARQDVGAFGSSVLIGRFMPKVRPEERINYLSRELLDPYLATVAQHEPGLATPAQRAAIQDVWIETMRGHLSTPIQVHKIERIN